MLPQTVRRQFGTMEPTPFLTALAGEPRRLEDIMDMGLTQVAKKNLATCAQANPMDNHWEKNGQYLPNTLLLPLP